VGRRPTKQTEKFDEAWWMWFTLLPDHHLRDQCCFVVALWTCNFMVPSKTPAIQIPLLSQEAISPVFTFRRITKVREEVETGIRAKYATRVFVPSRKF
jgi:hypothetical protein